MFIPQALFESEARFERGVRILYRKNLNVAQAIEQICADLTESPELEHLIAFVSTSARGIIK